MSTHQPPAREFVRTSLAVPGVSAVYGYLSDGLTPGLHRGLPSRYLTFIISLEEPITSADGPQAWAQGRLTRNEVLIGGMHTRPAYVLQPKRQVGIQLAVHPLAARRLFGLPAGALTALTHEGDDVLGREVAILRDRLHDLPTWEERFGAVEQFLWRRAMRAEDHPGPRREVAAAWHWLASTGGNGSVEELARHTSMSSRQLGTLIGREIGVGPKMLGRLMRFDRALAGLGAEIRNGRTPNLADLAQDCGYYDHSHLVRDFQRFTEASPTQFVAEELRNIQAGGHQPVTD
ncbi:AraC family transcriptional regulator [Skermania sp. ID1734]|uniref:AraC family transcriptional regulator n=1 Tax=Skermania sp. ID1734 TaxID=2597516 RepID=UPI00117FFDFD|nr:helix-turn-helix domain-containing protein [Skermania sp. ID1734]TSD94282.1 AraC family transcriptional regulator [Skermania sp. ID1734]